MDIVDLSEPFAADDDFSDSDFGNSQDTDWDSQSFLHQRKKTKSSTPKLRQPRIESSPEWEISQETNAPGDGMDVLLDESDDQDPPASTRNELGVFARKLESLNRKIPMGALKTAAQVTAATTPSGIPVDRFGAGDRVVHPIYGLGTIVSVEGRGLRRMARIAFVEGEPKSFQLSKASLTLQDG